MSQAKYAPAPRQDPDADKALLVTGCAAPRFSEVEMPEDLKVGASGIVDKCSPDVSNQSVEEEDPSVYTMIGQAETRPISQKQLVAKVKEIYEFLVMYVTIGVELRLSCRLQCIAD